MSDKPVIYCYIASSMFGGDALIATALAEDGTPLGNAVGSNVAESQRGVGYSSSEWHDAFARHYPDGYELVWVDDPATHEGLQAAIAKGQAMR